MTRDADPQTKMEALLAELSKAKRRPKTKATVRQTRFLRRSIERARDELRRRG